MRISHIKISGFRGIKNEVEIEIPRGFTVICGRNGSGKSTLCDAIEFALTGEIRPASQHTEKGETINDYLWWRGEGEASETSVSISFEGPNGKTYQLIRSQTEAPEDFRDWLCMEDISPPDAVKVLCKTMILRDEDITHLSIDLKETERYNLAREAIGTSQFAVFKKRAASVNELLTNRLNNLQGDYQKTRFRISDLTTRLSELRSESSKESEFVDAERYVREFLDQKDTPIAQVLSLGKNELADLRIKLDRIINIQRSLTQLMEREKEIDTKEFRDRLDKLKRNADKFKKRVEELSRDSDKLDQAINTYQQNHPVITSLATLNEHGTQLGLLDGHCPLCGSKISTTEYEKHLLELRKQVEKSSQELGRLLSDRSKLTDEQEQLMSELTELNKAIQSLSRESNEVRTEKRELMDSTSQLGLPFLGIEEFTPTSISNHAEEIRREFLELEKAIVRLETSRILDSISNVEKQIDLAREESDTLTRRIQVLEENSGRVRRSLKAINRVEGEIMDERLAQLTPLMAELYFRLRPHIDWRHLNYHLRGDVRKFLSLKVGNDLNPSFVLSSGQRRATGLAFLLAVHLSRPWCKLRTLILDDPIQHIDDYRSLHLTEILAAIRKSGHQIICTVEDSALAELLCRRLRSTTGEGGQLINMGYDSGIGVHKLTERTIRPFPERILKAS